MEKRTLYKEGTYKKGNLHTHTTWSDGMHTPAETAKHYRSKGYDFLALTDHWVYGIHPELNRDNVMDILKEEIGQVFVKVLEDAGVYKWILSCREERIIIW